MKQVVDHSVVLQFCCGLLLQQEGQQDGSDGDASDDAVQQASTVPVSGSAPYDGPSGLLKLHVLFFVVPPWQVS